MFERLSQRLTRSEIVSLGVAILAPGREDLREVWWDCWMQKTATPMVERAVFNAGWVATHWKGSELWWLRNRWDTIVERTILTTPGSDRRLCLTVVLHLLPMVMEPSSELSESQLRLLNFCLDAIAPMRSNEWSVGLCIKVVTLLVRHTPELRDEVRMLIEWIDEATCTPAIRAARNAAIKALTPQKKQR